MIQELFENDKEWMIEWQNMPEFIQQKNIKEYSKITIRFRNKEDLNNFSNLINQKLTNKTKSIWFPEIEKGKNSNKLYVCES